MDLSILGYVTAFLFVLWLAKQPHDMKKCKHETWQHVEARIHKGGVIRRGNNYILRSYLSAVNYEK